MTQNKRVTTVFDSKFIHIDLALKIYAAMTYWGVNNNNQQFYANLSQIYWNIHDLCGPNLDFWSGRISRTISVKLILPLLIDLNQVSIENRLEIHGFYSLDHVCIWDIATYKQQWAQVSSVKSTTQNVVVNIVNEELSCWRHIANQTKGPLYPHKRTHQN